VADEKNLCGAQKNEANIGQLNEKPRPDGDRGEVTIVEEAPIQPKRSVYVKHLNGQKIKRAEPLLTPPVEKR
jgi:hypothetical protein